MADIARASIRLVCAGLLSISLLLTALVVAAPGQAVADSPAATDGACPTSAGVTVVVDFQSLNDSAPIVRCTGRAVSSGIDALTAAGFTLDFVPGAGGFICRIDSLPTQLQQDCAHIPPRTAYWVYWYANPRGAGWTYSNLGAGSRVPPEGSVEGWSFSTGNNPAPRVSIPALADGVVTPAKPAALKAIGSPRAANFSVSWKQSVNATPSTRYQVMVRDKKSGRLLKQKLTKAASVTFVGKQIRHKLQAKPGRIAVVTITVIAQSNGHTSRAARTTLRIRK